MMLSAAHASEELLSRSENTINTTTRSLLGRLIIPDPFIENVLLSLLQFASPDSLAAVASGLQFFLLFSALSPT
jgi:hypothetical protein